MEKGIRAASGDGNRSRIVRILKAIRLSRTVDAGSLRGEEDVDGSCTASRGSAGVKTETNYFFI